MLSRLRNHENSVIIMFFLEVEIYPLFHVSVPFVPHVCFKAGVKSTSFKSNSRYCVDRKSVWRIFFKFRVNAALVLKRLIIPVYIICVQTEKKRKIL